MAKLNKRTQTTSKDIDHVKLLHIYIQQLQRIYNTYKVPVKSINISEENFKILRELIKSSESVFDKYSHGDLFSILPDKIIIYKSYKDSFVVSIKK